MCFSQFLAHCEYTFCQTIYSIINPEKWQSPCDTYVSIYVIRGAKEDISNTAPPKFKIVQDVLRAADSQFYGGWIHMPELSF